MSDSTNEMNLASPTRAQIRRMIRAKVGTRQCLNEATQKAIDATLTYGDLRSAVQDKETPANDFNDYFRFGG
jgi:hypothetical protein